MTTTPVRPKPKPKPKTPDPDRWQDTRLPLWLRVAFYAVDHTDETGRIELRPLELLWALDPTGLTPRPDISRAIHQAKRKGAINPGSSARRLILNPKWGGEVS